MKKMMMKLAKRRIPGSVRRAVLLALLLLLVAASVAQPAARKRASGRRRPRSSRPPAAAARRDTVSLPGVDDSLALAWVDSAIVAHGGPAGAAVRDMRYTVHLLQHGRDDAARGQASERYLRFGADGARMRIGVRSDTGLSIFACTPDSGWARGPRGFLDEPAAREFARAQLSLEGFLLRLPWALRSRAVRLPAATAGTDDGRPMWLVDADVHAGADLWRVGLDPQTHQVAMAEWWHYDRGAIPPESRALLDYAPVGVASLPRQLLLPARLRIYDGDGGLLRLECRYSDFRINTGLPDSLFTRP